MIQQKMLFVQKKRARDILFLLRLCTVFRNGLDRKRSKYMMLRINANRKNCLYLEKKSKNWTVFCSKGDPQCRGDNDCNFIQCKDLEKWKRLKDKIKNEERT